MVYFFAVALISFNSFKFFFFSISSDMNSSTKLFLKLPWPQFNNKNFGRLGRGLKSMLIFWIGSSPQYILCYDVQGFKSFFLEPLIFDRHKYSEINAQI